MLKESLYVYRLKCKGLDEKFTVRLGPMSRLTKSIIEKAAEKIHKDCPLKCKKASVKLIECGMTYQSSATFVDGD